MTCILQHIICILLQRLDVTFSGRAVQHTSLTESAATNTAALYFQYHTILRHFNIRNDRCLRIGRVRHIHDYLLVDHGRCMLVNREKLIDRSVFVISHIIEHRNIDAIDLTGFLQKVHTRSAIFLILFVRIQQFIIDRLALTDIKHIEKFCNRLRIIRTWTTTDHNRIFLGPVLRMKRNAGQV